MSSCALEYFTKPTAEENERKNSLKNLSELVGVFLLNT